MDCEKILTRIKSGGTVIFESWPEFETFFDFVNDAKVGISLNISGIIKGEIRVKKS